MTKTLSPSQLEVFKLCPRRWAEIYLNGKRIPPQDSALAGTHVHDLLEKFLRDGTPIDTSITWKDYPIGKIALDMTQHLPLPGSVPDVELTLDLEVDNVKYTGRVDARVSGKVYDHKTTSNLKYAKSAKKLQEDIQALIYARWMDSDGELQWTTGQSKNEIKSKKVVLPVLRDEVREKFDRIVTPLAKKVLAAYEHGDVKKLDKNKNACRLYPPKGCPFQNECWRPNMTTLKEKLAARIAAAKAANETETVAPERAAAVAADMAAIASLQGQPTIARLDSDEAGDPINPPLITSTGAPAEPVAVAETSTLPKKTRKRKVEIMTAETEASLKEQPEKLTRAEYERQGSRALHLAQESVLTPEENKAISEVTAAVVDRDTDKPIRTLFCDCLPLTSKVIHAHELIARAADTVEADMEVHHVKLIQFGQGGAHLSAQLENDIRQMTPGFDLALNSRTVEGREVMQTLMALAENVVVAL